MTIRKPRDDIRAHLQEKPRGKKNRHSVKERAKTTGEIQMKGNAKYMRNRNKKRYHETAGESMKRQKRAA